MESCVNESLHPSARHRLPGFITAPGDADSLMAVVHAMLLHVQPLLLPIKMLVLSGH
jgi:hypothetical protein